MKETLRLLRVVALYFCALLFVSCSGSKSKIVNITGSINGFNNDTIYIYGGDFFNRIDTLLISNNKISDEIEVDTLMLVNMYLPNGKHQPIFLSPGNKLIIEGDSLCVTVKGSEENDELNRFVEEVDAIKSELRNVEIPLMLRNYVSNNPDSYVTIYLLKKYLYDVDEPNLPLLSQLLQKLTGANRDRSVIEQLESEIRERQELVVGCSLPYYSFKNKNGKFINRITFKDKFLLLHFWASWDDESRAYNDELRQFVKQEKDNKDLAFMGFSLDSSREEWLAAIKADTLSWEQVYDSLSFHASFVQQCDVLFLPDNILVSPAGKVLARNIALEDIQKIIDKHRDTK